MTNANKDGQFRPKMPENARKESGLTDAQRALVRQIAEHVVAECGDAFRNNLLGNNGGLLRRNLTGRP